MWSRIEPRVLKFRLPPDRTLRVFQVSGYSYIELMFVIVVISILAALAVPYLQKARMSSNEASALTSVRTVGQGQVAYKNRYNGYATLPELVGEELIDGSLGSGSKAGYQFSMQNLSDDHFEIIAFPLDLGTSGQKGFYADETGVIRYTIDGALPSSSSSPVAGN